MTDAKKIKAIIEQGEGYRRKILARLVKLQIIERVGTRIAGEWIIIE
jgi:hypothetical protein